MTELENLPGQFSGRLSDEDYAKNFSELTPPLNDHEALVAADRCYFCYDAPCITACPTGIDIPLFIRQIATGVPEAAAMTIFDSNILGGMCARSCPTEVLCEEACVRETAEGKPVLIGQLQRYATDIIFAKGQHPYQRKPETGKRIAVVGSGPAGLACAHRLAVYGHTVEIFEKEPFLGGLNRTGIATYKTVDDFAQKEIDWLLKIGGITPQTSHSISTQDELETLLLDFDAVFLGVGLNGVNQITLENEIVSNAVDFIEALRLSQDYSEIPVGEDVVVIGGGMTAIDAAVQSKKLGAPNVSIVYRRSKDEMSASHHEIELAAISGVNIITNAVPVVIEEKGNQKQLKIAKTKVVNGQVIPETKTTNLQTDHVLMAIGQKLDWKIEDLKTHKGKIDVDEFGHTSIVKLWAGGDCIIRDDDLTVTAVAQGRDAAEDIHKYLSSYNQQRG